MDGVCSRVTGVFLCTVTGLNVIVIFWDGVSVCDVLRLMGTAVADHGRMVTNLLLYVSVSSSLLTD